MSEAVRPDPFAVLIPVVAARMRIAWDALRVPGPPPAFALTPTEVRARNPVERFRRRTIQLLDCPAGGDDRLVLVDKAMPHALFDLMLSEASPVDKPTPADVSPTTGRVLWRSGLEWVRFVSQPAHQRAFGLSGGQLHLALNCDPNTLDRESVQAAKQFHLHLLYWTAAELASLKPVARLADERSPLRRRQFMDPLSFLGARAIHAALSSFEFGIDGVQLLDCDAAAVAKGTRPLGCVVQLPGWWVLESSAFEDMIRRLHQRLARTGALLLDAFTDHADPPPPWQRHRLRPRAKIAERLEAAGWPRPLQHDLMTLAAGLRNLSSGQTSRLRRASAAARQHCMSLNLPCYGLNLFAPRINRPETPLIDADPVYLILQTKLFSGTGGAGLLGLDGIPSVRILRGCGHFDELDWQRRARLQRAFVLQNGEVLSANLGLERPAVRRLADFTRGWI